MKYLQNMIQFIGYILSSYSSLDPRIAGLGLLSSSIFPPATMKAIEPALFETKMWQKRIQSKVEQSCWCSYVSCFKKSMRLKSRMTHSSLSQNAAQISPPNIPSTTHSFICSLESRNKWHKHFGTLKALNFQRVEMKHVKWLRDSTKRYRPEHTWDLLSSYLLFHFEKDKERTTSCVWQLGFQGVFCFCFLAYVVRLLFTYKKGQASLFPTVAKFWHLFYYY